MDQIWPQIRTPCTLFGLRGRFSKIWPFDHDPEVIAQIWHRNRIPRPEFTTRTRFQADRTLFTIFDLLTPFHHDPEVMAQIWHRNWIPRMWFTIYTRNRDSPIFKTDLAGFPAADPLTLVQNPPKTISGFFGFLTFFSKIFRSIGQSVRELSRDGRADGRTGEPCDFYMRVSLHSLA